MTTLTIVLPTYSEGESIYSTLKEISECAESLNLKTEIYISEDGSKDNTRSEVLRANKDCKTEIKLSEVSERLGYSRAVQNSIKNCSSDILIFMDSDGQYDPTEIAKLLEKLEPNSIVCGYRNPRIDPWQRIFYSSLFKGVFYIFFRIKLIDPSSPFIAAYSKDIAFLQNIKIKLDYGFWWEFQARVNQRNLKVIEIPVRHRQRLVGKTQVYKITKLPRIIITHLIGLYKLKKELS